MALKRIKKELNDFSNSPIEGITLTVIDENDMFHWKASFAGPNNSPYEGGIFVLDIIMPLDYPFKPPKFKLVTKVYHPNIDSQGEIWLDILKNQWSPALTVAKAILSVQSLLCDPNVTEPRNRDIA